MRWLIYALTDPRTDEIRYVGKSCSGLQRPRTHATPKALAIDLTAKGNWIRKLKRLGLRYGTRVLEGHASREHLGDAEQRWILAGRRLGWRLLNLTDGGDGAGHPTSEATKAKLRALKLGKKREGGWKRPDTSARNRGGLSPTTIARRTASRGGDNGLRGRVMPQEHRSKIGVSMLGNRNRGGQRAGIRTNLLPIERS